MPNEEEVIWKYWIHLPGLVLEQGRELPIADGRLRGLTHDEWHALDETVWQPVDYGDTRPAFYCGETRGRRDSTKLHPEIGVLKTVLERRKLLHRAFALAVDDWPILPDPSLSCTYIQPERNADSQTLDVGTSGRDWILTGRYREPRHEVTPKLMARAEATLGHLQSLKATMPGSTLEVGLQALSLAALPDTYNGLSTADQELNFVGGIAAIEQIIVPRAHTRDKDSSITSIFGRHSAALLTPDFDSLDARAKLFRQIYQLRSDLMHGRRGIDMRDDTNGKAFATGLLMLPWILIRVVAILAALGPSTDLPAYLARAFADRERFTELSEILSPRAFDDFA